jgi:hypothetical protein
MKKALKLITLMLVVCPAWRATARSLYPWAGTYRDAEITLELKAQANDDFEGLIRFQDQKFPVNAHADGRQLTGAFRSGEGSFDFVATADGDKVSFTTGGKTYQLRKEGVNPLAGGAPPANPLAAPVPPPREGAPPNGTGGVPAGYRVVTATDFGKKLVTHKAEAASVLAALQAARIDLSRCFDAVPAITGAFLDNKDRRRGGAQFTAELHGQPF